MGRTEEIEEIKAKICDDYCRYTQDYLECYKDPDEAYEKLLADMCQYCPLTKL